VIYRIALGAILIVLLSIGVLSAVPAVAGG
jgi:hypothetical protein